jgi:hypothetical protein
MKNHWTKSGKKCTKERGIMDIRLAQILADTCDGEVRDDYSGRGMCGKETGAVVVDSVEYLLSTVLENIEDISDEIKDEEDIKIGSIRIDSMGLSIVVY